MTMTLTAVNGSDVDYQGYLDRFQAQFEQQAGGPLFTTDATDLWDTYLAAIPEAYRQYYTCHACRDFVRRFGALVAINADGKTTPVFWGDSNVPAEIAAATAAVARLARRAKVTGVFLSSETVWGRPVTGEWHHLSVTPANVFRGSLLSASQAAAAKKEDFGQVMRALAEFSVPVLQQAVTLLEAEQLYRGEKLLGGVQWLRDLAVAWSGSQGQSRSNLVWRAVATAPAGFCHPRSGMAGTLLEDLAAGMSFDEVARRFAAKMHPLQYQRPQAAPTAGNIAQAEKMVEQLGLKSALSRRFARLDEVEALWRPTVETEPATEGVFGHLKPKGAAEPMAVGAPAAAMTWVKFAREVLPNARTIDFCVVSGHGPFVAFVTAMDPESAPLLQWDLPERRNPVSWYFWNGGSPPSQWGLAPGWCPVTAVSLFPHQWGENPNAFSHHGNGVAFFLQSARESRIAGCGLFPEMLRSELHRVRATLEAYSRGEELSGRGEGSACGIGLKGERWANTRLRVRTATGVSEYLLDRWD